MYPYPTLSPRIPLEAALKKIADKFNFDTDELIAYAEEDGIGGYHHDVEQRGCKRGIWGVEGQVVYAVMRALRPSFSLEVGNRWGCSGKHMDLAVNANDYGRILSIDILEDVIDAPVIGMQYSNRTKFQKADLFEFKYKTRPKIGFLFEDSNHTPHMVSHVWREFVEHAKPGAIIISHDSEHFSVGEHVQRGIKQVTNDYLSIAIAPADCGLAMWRKP